MQTQTSASTRVLEVSHFRRPSACGLRPECSAITVAVKSPEDKKRTPKKIQDPAPATEIRTKTLENNTARISPATATAARQHDHQRALDARRKERSRKRKGGGSITQASITRFVSPRAVPSRCISAGWEASRPQAVAICYHPRSGQ